MINYFLKKINENGNNNTAVIIEDKKITYLELLNKIETIYSIISDSFNKNKIVIIKGDYSFNSISLLFALVKHKCVIVPIISENKTELEKKIEISNPDYIIDSESLNITLNKNKVKKSNDHYNNLFRNNKSGLILFSSGSTGLPKAMVHDFDNLLDSYSKSKSKNLVIILFLMFDHIGGLNTMLNILSMGSTMVIPNKREPEIIGNIIEKNKVNILPASPTFLNLMNIAGVFDTFDFSSLKLITYGTEPMPKSLLKILKTKLPKTRLIQTFGTSETGIIKTKSKSSSSLLIKFDDKDQDTKIIDGELWIKSKTRILGYINHNNNSFSKDGWFKTGDIVEEKENGYYQIIGRKSSVINVGGEKVLPIEVENVILELKNVQDCTVFGKDNPITGQVVAANIVVKSLDEGIKQIKKNVKMHCKKNLERYKVPTQIIIKDNVDYSTRYKKKLF